MTAAPPGALSTDTDQAAVRALYLRLIDAWNRRHAGDFAATFDDEGYALGFDGSLHRGRAEIEFALAGIFAAHPTGRYVVKVKELRVVTQDVALLRAITGLVMPGTAELNAATNAWQTIVAVRRGDGFRIAQLQNTPAAFHGRPALARQMTDELAAELR